MNSNYKIPFQSRIISKNLLESIDVHKSKKPKKVYIPLYKNGKNLDSIYKVGDAVSASLPIGKDKDEKTFIYSTVSGEIKSISEGELLNGEYAFIVEIDVNEDKEHEVEPLKSFDSESLSSHASKTGNHDILAIEEDDHIYLDTRYRRKNYGLYNAVFSKYMDEVIKGIGYIQKSRNLSNPILLITDKKRELDLIAHISKLGVKNIKVSRKKIAKKMKKISLEDCINFYEAVTKGKISSEKFIFISGNSIKNPGFYRVSMYTAIDDIIEIAGGLKHGYDEIDKFKEDAAILMNEQMVIKQEIKKEKSSINKLKLIKMLKEKREYARENIYNNLGNVRKKYRLCLKNIVFCLGDKSMEATSTENSVDKGTSGIYFISNGEKSFKSFDIDK